MNIHIENKLAELKQRWDREQEARKKMGKPLGCLFFQEAFEELIEQIVDEIEREEERKKDGEAR